MTFLEPIEVIDEHLQNENESFMAKIKRKKQLAVSDTRVEIVDRIEIGFIFYGFTQVFVYGCVRKLQAFCFFVVVFIRYFERDLAFQNGCSLSFEEDEQSDRAICHHRKISML